MSDYRRTSRYPLYLLLFVVVATLLIIWCAWWWGPTHPELGHCYRVTGMTRYGPVFTEIMCP